MSYCRTQQHRELRAELIRNWKPWERSTGPKSAQGKARVSVNSHRGAVRPLMRRLSKVLRRQRVSLESW